MAGYFDHAATSGFHPPEVREVVLKLLQTSQGSLGRSSGAIDVSKRVRSNLKLLSGINDSFKVVFTASATEALNTILKGLVLSHVYGKKMELTATQTIANSAVVGSDLTVLHTPFCHNAVLRPLYYLERTYGLVRQVMPFNDFFLDVEGTISQLCASRPIAVVFPAIGNVFGNVLPVKLICALVRKYSPETFIIVDGAQAVGAMELAPWSNYCDFIVFAGHKTLLGLPGVSGFITNGRVLLEPLIHGGTGVDSVLHDNPRSIPERYEAGTRNIYALAALEASTTWLLEQGIDAVQKHEQSARTRLLEILSDYSWIHPLLPTKPKASDLAITDLCLNSETNEPIAQASLNEFESIGKEFTQNWSSGIISVNTDYISVDEATRVLSEQGVITRAGLECAPLAHAHMGTAPSGTLRFSVNVGTNEEDFVVLRQALNTINEGLGL